MQFLSIFDLIYCDLWGPYNTPSACSALYFLTLLDDYLMSMWIYLLARKRELPNILKTLAMVHTIKKSVKIVRFDNGIEFVFLKNYFEEKGILHQSSVVGTS